MREAAVRVGDTKKVDRQREKAVQFSLELVAQVSLLAQALGCEAQLEFVYTWAAKPVRICCCWRVKTARGWVSMMQSDPKLWPSGVFEGCAGVKADAGVACNQCVIPKALVLSGVGTTMTSSEDR